MNMTREQRRLQQATETHKQHVKLVHSSRKGWLTVGLTVAFIAGGIGLSSNRIVSASAPDTAGAVSTTTDISSPPAWSVRPIQEIKKQYDESEKKVYDVKWGDTLSTIAEALNNSGFNTSVKQLAKINHITNVDLIYAGTQLILQPSEDTTSVASPDSSTGTSTDKIAIKPTTNTTSSISTPKQSSTNTANAGTKTGAPSTSSHIPVNVDRYVSTNIDGVGNVLTAAQVASGRYYVSSTSVPHKTVGTSANGDTVTTYTTTTIYNKITTTTKQATINVDESGKVLSTTDGYDEVSRSSDKGNSVTDIHGNMTITVTTTVVYKLHDDTTPVDPTNPVHVPVNTNKYVTVKVDGAGNVLTAEQLASGRYYVALVSKPYKTVVTAENGDTVTTYTTTTIYNQRTNSSEKVTVATDEAGNVLSSTDGYDEVSRSTDAGKSVTDANGNMTTTYTTTIIYKKHVDTHVPVNTDINVVVKQDEAGATLTSTDGYKLINTSTPVKSVVTAENGDTTTTYTTTETYHQIETSIKQATVNVDETGKILSSTDGYDEVSRSTDPGKSVTAANGDVTTVVTTTIVYKKHADVHVPVNTNKDQTIAIDEKGNTITPSSDYHLMSTSDPVKSVVTAENGDTTTTYTTTETYHLIAHSTKEITVNVDSAGKVLDTIDGYDEVSRSTDAGKDTVAANGDIIKTVTTTVTYTKHVESASYVVVINDANTGKKITSLEVVENLHEGDEIVVNAPEVNSKYGLVSPSSQTVTLKGGLNTVVFTAKLKVAYSVQFVDESGNVISTPQTDITGKYEGDSLTVNAPSIPDGYELVGQSSQSITLGSTNNVVKFVIKKKTVANDASYTVLGWDSSYAMMFTNTITGKHVGDVITVTAPDKSSDGYSIVGDKSKTITLAAGDNEVEFDYELTDPDAYANATLDAFIKYANEVRTGTYADAAKDEQAYKDAGVNMEYDLDFDAFAKEANYTAYNVVDALNKAAQLHANEMAEWSSEIGGDVVLTQHPHEWRDGSYGPTQDGSTILDGTGYGVDSLSEDAAIADIQGTPEENAKQLFNQFVLQDRMHHHSILSSVVEASGVAVKYGQNPDGSSFIVLIYIDYTKTDHTIPVDPSK